MSMRTRQIKRAKQSDGSDKTDEQGRTKMRDVARMHNCYEESV